MHVQRVAFHFYARAIDSDFLHDRAKKNSFYIRRLESGPCVQGILGYFPEISAFRKGLFCGLEGEEVLEERPIEYDFDWTSSDSEIFKFASDPRDVAFFCSRGVFRIETRHDTINRENVEHIQMFQNRSGERVVAVVLDLMTARNMAVTLLERNEIAKLEILDACVAMPADNGQRALRLNIYLMMKGPSELRTESVRTGVVMEGAGSFLGHTYHLNKITTGALMLLNSGRKCNCKWEFADRSRAATRLVEDNELVVALGDSLRDVEDYGFLCHLL